MSRTAAVRLAAGRRIDKELDAIGSSPGPAARKARGGTAGRLQGRRPGGRSRGQGRISKKVARLRPIGVIMGMTVA